VPTGTIACVDEVIVGSEAIAQGLLTRGQLRWNYRPILPDIYIPKSICRSLELMTVGAWLWSGRRAVITGRAAAALYGAEWVDEYAPVELLWRNNHCPPGTIARHERFQPDEVASVRGLPVATPARTGFDLARHLPRTMAVAHLDALARATGIRQADVLRLVDRYPGARGNKRARTAIDLLDAGAESPKESWLRLLLADAGFPRPTTQIRVADAAMTAFVDMGWEDLKIGVEYDGDHHRTSRRQFLRDIARIEMLEGNGWIIIRVVIESQPADILERVRHAFARRGYALRPRDSSQGRDAA
jgi:very-short-patch-repair endonuclease